MCIFAEHLARFLSLFYEARYHVIRMAKTLKVQLTTPGPDWVHQFRNFGEDVYRDLRDQCEVSIAEIDASISEFHLRGIHKRDVRSIAARVRKLIEKRYQELPPIKVCEMEADEDEPTKRGSSW